MLSEDVIKYLEKIGFTKYQNPNFGEPSLYVYGRKCSCCNRSSEIHIYDDGSFNAYDERPKSDTFTGYHSIISEQRYKTPIIESIEDVNKILCEVFGERLWRR